MALTYKTLSLKKFLFIFLSCLLFQQLTAQTIVKFDNGNNIIYKNLQGKTIVKNKKYTIAFTDTISSIGFVGTKKVKQFVLIMQVKNYLKYIRLTMVQIMSVMACSELQEKIAKQVLLIHVELLLFHPFFRMLHLFTMERLKFLLAARMKNKENTNHGKATFGF